MGQSTQQIRVIELGHVVLYVRDLARSAEFYGQILGWQRVDTPSEASIAAFSGGRTHHELLLIEVGAQAAPKPEHLQVGLYHFGLKIGDSDAELVAAVKALHKHGVSIVGATDHHVTHSLYIADPDGNEIELYIDVPGVDWRADPSLIARPGQALRLDLE